MHTLDFAVYDKGVKSKKMGKAGQVRIFPLALNGFREVEIVQGGDAPGQVPLRFLVVFFSGVF